MGNGPSQSSPSGDNNASFWHARDPNVVVEDDEPSSSSSSPSSSSSRDAPVKEGGPLVRAMMRRKQSSFLSEPVVNKSTERGEVAASIAVDDASDDETVEVSIDSDALSIDILRHHRRSRSDRDDVDDDDGNRNSKNIRYAISEMQGWRSHMEDEHLLNPKLTSIIDNNNNNNNNNNNQQLQQELLRDHHLFAVFDGHGGDFASHYCGRNFVDTLLRQRDWQAYLGLSSQTAAKQGSVKGLALLKSSLTSAFLDLDARLMTAQRERRIDQLSQLQNLVYSYGDSACIGAVTREGVFRKGSADYESVLNFHKKLPGSLPSNIGLERSGSTAVVVLITPTHIVCANAGDSRAILAKRGDDDAAADDDDEKSSGASNANVVLPLSFDHKPKNHVEVSRVERNQGFVRGGRVDGELAVSRGFGDFCYKNCSSSSSSSSSENKKAGSSNVNNNNNNKVTVHPDILIQKREPSKDEFVVLACDGIWDVLENRECADLVRTLANDEGESDVGLICEEIIDTSLELDSRDNMTACVVMFPNADNNGGNNKDRCREPNSDISSSPSSHHGVLKRRIDRMRSLDNDDSPSPARKRAEQRRRREYRLEERRMSQQRKSISRTRGRSPGSTNRSKATSQATKKNSVVKRPPIIQERKRSEEGRDSPLGHADNVKGKKLKAAAALTATINLARARSITKIKR